VFNLIKISIVASICLYLIGQAMAWSAESSCKGWDCQEVTCWDGYAVKVDGGKYVPCEKLDDYLNGKKDVVL